MTNKSFKHNFQAILIIAQRDFLKLIRDKGRIIASLMFPFIFISVLGGSFQASIKDSLGFDFMLFVFTGVLAQTLFQSTASGIISLIEDRENDFSQELFITPVSRYTIIFGKILGESLVSLTQLIGIFVFGYILGLPLGLENIIYLLPVFLIICIFGGSFGVLVLSRLSSQRSANQIFPFIIFPQIFLAGIFNPLKDLPMYLYILSRLSPMTYAIDLFRNVFYFNDPSREAFILYPIETDFMIVLALTAVFLALGTTFFVKNEKNR